MSTTTRHKVLSADRQVQAFNKETQKMVCDLDDQLVRYIGRNLNSLNAVQVKEVLDFVRALRTLKDRLL